MIATVVLVLRFALTIALYSFLGWSMVTMWRELKQQGKILGDRKLPSISITITPVHGKDRQMVFSQPEIIIGRHANCDISMLDETLSTQHARLAYHHSQWWLEDLNSTNGTFLNGRKLQMPAVLITEDEFKCGAILFSLRIESGQVSTIQN